MTFSPAPLPILAEIAACRRCEMHLPHPPRPVLAASATARLLIIGQAPGRRVQQSGIPWSDASGELLRRWLCMTPDEFYDASRIAILPLGFCYPGTGSNGDLPPRPECAPLWHQKLLDQMPEVGLTLLIGSHAQHYYLGDRAKRTLTETVASWGEYLPRFFPLPHPSPRNRFWFSRHSWFETAVLPALQARVSAVFTEQKRCTE